MQHKFTASFGAPVRLEWVASEAKGLLPVMLDEPMDLQAGSYEITVDVALDGNCTVNVQAVLQ